MPLINFSGLASGIDSEALIEATSDVTRQAAVEPKENQISELEDANDALTELKSKLSALKTIVDSFATLNGGVVAKEGISSDETVLTATASNSASPGSYNVTVAQVAKNGTFSFASSGTYTSTSQVLSPTAANPPNDVTVYVGSAAGGERETVTVAVDNATTLEGFVSEFNTESSQATAEIVNVGTDANPDYVILINSLYEGLAKGEITLGTYPTNFDTDVDDTATSQARDAQFTIDGISGTITRPSNTVNDLLAGVTLQLSGTGNSTISISTDVSTTSSSIEDYVNQYNEIVQFLDENNLIERQEEGEDVQNIFGALAKTTVDDNSLTSLKSEIFAATAASGSSIKIFADLGITTERDGTLKIDTDKLEEGLNNEATSVQELFRDFADSAGLTGGTLDQFIRFNGLFDTTVTANKNRISSLNDEIARQEGIIAKREEGMRARFARLESAMSQMQAQQQNLSSILGSIQ